MKAFDGKNEIRKLHTLLSKWEQSEGKIRKYRVKPQKTTAESVAAAGKAVMVFRSDMLTELGGPTQGSINFVLCTEDNDAVLDNEVILVGEDIPEMTKGEYPFAQIIIVSGSGLDDGEYYKAAKYSAPPGLTQGFMIKSAQGNIWCRVARTAAEEGLRFETLGKRLLEFLKADCPFVKKAEIVYVVSTAENIDRLKPIETAAKALRKKIKTKIWNERGVDLQACTQWGHCGKCKNKTICDEVRRIQSAYRSN